MRYLALALLLLQGCSLKLGRFYGLEERGNARFFCAPCLNFGESRDKGFGIIFYQ